MPLSLFPSPSLPLSLLPSTQTHARARAHTHTYRERENQKEREMHYTTLCQIFISCHYRYKLQHSITFITMTFYIVFVIRHHYCDSNHTVQNQRRRKNAGDVREHQIICLAIVIVRCRVGYLIIVTAALRACDCHTPPPSPV